MSEKQKQEGGGSRPWKIHSQETLRQHLAYIRLSRLRSPKLSKDTVIHRLAGRGVTLMGKDPEGPKG